MKKVFLLLLLASFLPLTSIDAQTTKPILNSDDLVISIKPLRPTVRPRTITVSDVEAYYSNEALTLIFNKDMGDVDIEVVNLSNGDMWLDSVSGVCATSILLSGDAGHYSITIYTSECDYYGEFEL